MDDYDVRTLPQEQLVVFIASTTGEGTVPDNMRSFWRFLLRKDLPAGSLGAMQHACFGLGDSSYPKFNYAAKRLHRRLLQLGSTALVDLGLADDQDDLGIDQALGPWLDGFRARLMALRPMADGLAAIPRSQSLPLRYRLLEEEEEEEADGAATVAGPPPEPGGPPSAAAPFEARVLANESLCGAARGSRDVRHLELDIAGSGIAYTPGDALAVQPRNPPAETRALLAGLGLEPEQRIVLAPAAPRAAPPLPPGEWSVFRLFSERLDLFGVPRRAFFERLARHVGRAAAPTHTSGVAPASATDACVRLCRRRPPRRTRPRRPALALEPGTRAAAPCLHRTHAALVRAQRLAEFGTPQFADDLRDYCSKPRRTYAEVRQAPSSCRPSPLPPLPCTLAALFHQVLLEFPSARPPLPANQLVERALDPV